MSSGAPLYYHAGRANTEVAHLGRALRFLRSTGIAFVPGSHEQDGRRVRNPRRDALLGFFEDDARDDYLMVTNIWHEKDTSAFDAVQTITLTFAPEVRTIARLSRETGRPETLVVPDGKLVLRLPGGTGDLFKLDDDVFPGVE